MAKEKFLLVSLKEDESKKLAQIISNDSSRKILDYLAEKDATESEISEKLNIPISTVHYNLQALLNGKLVEADEYHYSQKGKEILHYKLANKYIIIAPKSVFGIKEKLRKILPATLFAVAGSAVIYLIQQFSSTTFSASKNMIASAPMAERAADTSSMLAKSSAQGMLETVTPSFWQTFIQTPALWFLFGCLFTLLLVVVIEYIHYKKQN